MSLFFLIPLVVGLGALLVYLRWMDEGAPIFGLAAVLGLLTALVLAPWQVQAGLLVLATGLARYLLQQRGLPVGPREGAAIAAVTPTPAATTAATAAATQGPDQGTSAAKGADPVKAIATPQRPRAVYRGIVVDLPASGPATETPRDRAAAGPSNAAPKSPQLRYRGRPVDPSA